jgi:uncharacterized protein (DUF169 family)
MKRWNVSIADSLQTDLGLERPPVAIAFLDRPPAGVSAWSGGAVAAGCVFWRKAQEGAVFYTVPADHYNCAVGAYTHRIDLPAERATELSQTLNFMIESRYLGMEEVPGIPTLTRTPEVIAYGPLDRVAFVPDVVVLTVNPAQAMLLYEAAIKAGVGGALLNTLGRPACALLPLALHTDSAAVSLGCTGNRAYTGLPATEMYVGIPGDKWQAVAEQLAIVLSANAAIGDHHRQRQAQFAGAN